MKAVIRYFSGSGNTRHVAEVIGQQLQDRGYTVSCGSIETGVIDLSPADLLVIGGPIMAGNVPELLIRWVLKEIPVVSRGTALVFTTSAGLQNANGVHSLTRKLVKKGYQVAGQPAFRMPRNYYFGRYQPTPAEEQLRLIKAIPSEVAQALAGMETSGQVSVPQGAGTVLTMDLMAELFSLIARGMGKKLTSFHDDCIGCGRCIRECPRQNIAARTGGGVLFQGKCMMCTRCLHGCPVHAIGYDRVKYEQYPGPEKLMRPGVPD